MGLTRFPNGLTVNSTTALQYSTSATDGDVDCNRLFVAGAGSVGGTLTVGTLAGTVAMTVQGSAGQGFIGQRIVMTGTFTSAASTQIFPVPFNGNIVDAFVLCDTTPTVCSAFTVRASSAGAVAVASVALTFATVVGQQVRPTVTPVAVTTALAWTVIVTTAGSAANFGFSVVFEKSA